ncbi:MAG TPA: quinolinate synthase NadA [Candidatus Nanoarchaeia archaeon]|nr:quinolinate synthase NadA [Candidatus Nanoarchaeia archaeon]
MIDQESKRLHAKLKNIGWTEEDCRLIAPLTLEINKLKKEQDAIILAHSYQSPDIVYGIADFVGDSYGLSVKAAKEKAKKIVFCSVHFMGETAKLLSPEKEVFVPAVAGCSLAESIKPEDVRALRKRYPKAGIVGYVNTSAAVKAECDACCTSANVVKVVEAMPQKDVVFIPDKLMGKNLQKLTSKNIILWNGTCIVHEEFRPESVDAIRQQYPDAKILAHTECEPVLVDKVDFAGSTSQMINYIKEHEGSQYMLITECGLTDRVKAEFPQKSIVGTCNLCPYMKEIMLKDVLQVLKHPRKDQKIEIPTGIAIKARKALDKMFELEKLTDAR